MTKMAARTDTAATANGATAVRVSAPGVAFPTPADGGRTAAVPDAGPDAMIEALVRNALTALADFEGFDQERVDHIVKKASVAALHEHVSLAQLAVEETGRGVFEDKAVKNIFACEHVTHHMAGLKTVGVINRDEINGIVEIAEPVGVVCAVTPVTNPTSTTIFKALIALKTRNPVIFAFHPAAQRCSAAAARVVRDAAVAAGAPAHCIQWIEQPSLAATGALMHHPGVATILATGGNAMVRAAYSAGKPALGVGAGNVPAYVERSADIGRAVNDIVLSKSFDNGMICASEQAVIIDTEIYEATLEAFAGLRAYRVSAAEKRQLEEFMFGVAAHGAGCDEAVLNTAVVGRSPAWIAQAAGFAVPADTSVLLVEVDRVGPAQPLTREKLCPVLAVLRSADHAQGFEFSAQMVRFNGLGHSAVIHTADEDLVEAVRQPGAGGSGAVELAGLAGRHRGHVQRAHAVADPGLRQLRPQLGVQQRLRRASGQHQAGGPADQQPAVVQGATEDLLRAVRHPLPRRHAGRARGSPWSPTPP